MKPNDQQRPWKGEPAINRLENCRVMLRVHGFLTAAEGRKVAERIMLWHFKEASKAKKEKRC